jgi:hypothetical protein
MVIFRLKRARMMFTNALCPCSRTPLQSSMVSVVLCAFAFTFRKDMVLMFINNGLVKGPMNLGFAVPFFARRDGETVLLLTMYLQPSVLTEISQTRLRRLGEVANRLSSYVQLDLTSLSTHAIIHSLIRRSVEQRQKPAHFMILSLGCGWLRVSLPSRSLTSFDTRRYEFRLLYLSQMQFGLSFI